MVAFSRFIGLLMDHGLQLFAWLRLKASDFGEHLAVPPPDGFLLLSKAGAD